MESLTDDEKRTIVNLLIEKGVSVDRCNNDPSYYFNLAKKLDGLVEIRVQ